MKRELPSVVKDKGCISCPSDEDCRAKRKKVKWKLRCFCFLDSSGPDLKKFFISLQLLICYGKLLCVIDNNNDNRIFTLTRYLQRSVLNYLLAYCVQSFTIKISSDKTAVSKGQYYFENQSHKTVEYRRPLKMI